MSKIYLILFSRVPSPLPETGLFFILSPNVLSTAVRQLQNEWAISDTARLGYQAALKGELLKSAKK